MYQFRCFHFVYAVRGALDFIFYRDKSKVGHQFHDIARREMPPGIGDVCFFIEFADHFFKYRAHRMIVERRQKDIAGCVLYGAAGKVDGRICELTDEQSEDKIHKYISISNAIISDCSIKRNSGRVTLLRRDFKRRKRLYINMFILKDRLGNDNTFLDLNQHRKPAQNKGFWLPKA